MSARPSWTSITVLPLVASLIAAVAAAVLLQVGEETRHRFDTWLRERGAHRWEPVGLRLGQRGITLAEAGHVARPRLRHGIAYLVARWVRRPVIQRFPEGSRIPPSYRVVTVDTLVETIRTRDPELADQLEEAFSSGVTTADPAPGSSAFPDMTMGLADPRSATDAVRAAFGRTRVADTDERSPADTDLDAEETA